MGWAEFHKQADYEQSRYRMTPAADSKENIDVERTDLKISIPTTKSVEVSAKLTTSPLVDSLGSLRFNLLNQFGAVTWRDTARPITVLSVTDSTGAALPYIHKRNELFIRLPKRVGRGEHFVVNVSLREDTIIQVTPESYVIYNTYPWFPQYGYLGGRYAFDFNIEIQRPLSPVGSGHIVKEWENQETKMNGVELKMDDQVSLASILFGRFHQEKGVYHSLVSNKDIALTVYAFPTMTFDGEATSIPQGKMKAVLAESEEIIKFYEEQLYGPYPFGDLTVAQMYPESGYGQAPPALVQLDGLAFLSQEVVARIYKEAEQLHHYLSHEIAHQYWAHVISWANDHDQWLSESFAEYSSGIYFLALLGPKRFEQKLEDWKKAARHVDPMGPIALSTLLSGDNAETYRQELVYDKGPLVVHMIRTQLGDDDFKKFMKNFLAKYKGQNLTTEMLSLELSAYTKYSWDYFFDQWFRGVGIPEIHYKYSVTPQAGKYLFELTLRQKDADNFKKILKLPVTWKGSSKEQLAEKDFMFGQQGQVYKLVLPFEPREVQLDPNRTLLADFVQDK